MCANKKKTINLFLPICPTNNKFQGVEKIKAFYIQRDFMAIEKMRMENDIDSTVSFVFMDRCIKLTS